MKQEQRNGIDSIIVFIFLMEQKIVGHSSESGIFE